MNAFKPCSNVFITALYILDKAGKVYSQPKFLSVKFDDQLAAYLYETRSLKLEGIGTFTLDPKVSVPGAEDKEVYYPIEGLSFVYNPKSTTDEDLIVFLVKKLHKIEPLIRSDLESYLSNIKQFVNIGKPYTIVGVGTLSKDNYGTYEFTPGNFLPAKEELDPKRENAEHNYPVRSQSNAGRVLVVIVIVIAALAALGGIGWGISNFMSSQRAQQPQNENQQGILDTLMQPADTFSIPKPALQTSKPAPVATQLVQKQVIQQDIRWCLKPPGLRERALARTSQLNTYGNRARFDTVYIGDSLRYRLYIPMRLPVSDTVRARTRLPNFWVAGCG